MYMLWCNVEVCLKYVWVFYFLIIRNKLLQEKLYGVKNIYICRWF